MKLKMDVNQTLNMGKQMIQTFNEITQVMKDVQATCNALVGVSWKSQAANQFQQALNQWRTSSEPKLQQLQQNKQRLDREVQQWQQAASHFG